MRTKKDCFVLMRKTRARHGEEDSGSPVILGVYDTIRGVELRMENVRKCNVKYPLRQVGELSWVIGPEEDEGFFGSRPVDIWAKPSKFYESV